MLIGAAIVWFLIVPAINHNKATKTNQDVVAYSDQIAAKESEISTLKKQVKDFQAKEKELEAEKQKAANTQSSYEALVNVIEHYHQNSQNRYNTSDLIDEMLALTTDSLGEVGKAQYEAMAEEIFPKQCQKLYRSARQSFRVENYGTAIEGLEKVMQMDETYEDGKALLMLADSYAGNGETEKATEKYNRVIELFPDSDVAEDAKEALNGPKEGAEDGAQQ